MKILCIEKADSRTIKIDIEPQELNAINSTGLITLTNLLESLRVSEEVSELDMEDDDIDDEDDEDLAIEILRNQLCVQPLIAMREQKLNNNIKAFRPSAPNSVELLAYITKVQKALMDGGIIG